MGRRTPLYDRHVALGARLVDFGGWDMPLHYGSQLEEHHAVRRAAGVFDVSHMAAVDLRGAAARQFLQRLLANDVARLKETGRALYSCMLNEQGGVIDDLIAYWLGPSLYRLIVNAGTAGSDYAWIEPRARELGVAAELRSDLGLLAVQGPQARAIASAQWSAADARVALALAPMSAAPLPSAPGVLVARTGYTGEDGFEIMLPAADLGTLWDALIAAGVRPCGLGARDTLRLEAGMNLYGADMDASTTPLETGLAWTVDFGSGRAFIGRAALEAQRRAGVAARRVGLLLEDKGVLRAHQPVRTDAGDGIVTSGGFAPTLARSIALARVPSATGAEVTVEIRGRALRARVVDPPFVRHGRALVPLT
jgi:aminomethyltransferase